ncbi:carbohydrate ABC transporter permease [Paenibacillus psychroresistens]|uniref:Carbohydrate ABC transporter permease n=2 Tax=Paenibacillus psychroresistens TaxID=1778678 RepID=A0A6B8RVJ8_9BACL|nr:carbohydrate ABC transporter permease [Paenibacillus psychroresistens]
MQNVAKAYKAQSFNTLIIHIIFILVTLSMLLPFILVIIISITDEQSLSLSGYQLIPEKISFSAYQYFFKAPQILIRAYGVTTFVTVIGTVISLLLTATLGYAISRRDYGYNRILTFFIFFTMLFNGGLVPFYILMTQWLHLGDTIFALIVPGLINPFYILIMKGFMSKIPMEIIESAKIDGAREWRIFYRIILPLSMPALATLGLFISFAYWNEWFNGLLFINNERLVPLQLLLIRSLKTLDFITSRPEFSASVISLDMSQFPQKAAKFAIAIIAGGPMLVIFPFFQRFFIKGLTVGALKG